MMRSFSVLLASALSVAGLAVAPTVDPVAARWYSASDTDASALLT